MHRTPNRRVETPGVREPAPRSSRWVVVVAILAVIVGIAGWLDGRRTERDLRNEVAERLTAVEATTQATGKAQTDLATEMRDAQARTTLLETRIAESQAQQAALEALYRDLAPSRDEIALSEIEQVLLVASQQLQLAGNVPSALTALQLADAKLQRLDRPQFVPLRRALSREMDQLRAVPFVDVTGISLKLDQAIAAVGTLPFAMDERLPPSVTEADVRRPTNRRGSGSCAMSGRTSKQLVRIEVVRSAPPRRCSCHRSNISCARIFACGCCRRASRSSTTTTRASGPTSRRRRRGSSKVFRHARETRAGAAGDVEAARRDTAGRRDARSFAQPRSAARAAALAGPRARAPRRRRSRALTPPAVRILFWFLLLAAAAVGVALAAKVVNGYALFVAPPYRVELSLNLLLLLLVVGFVGGYALLRLALRTAACRATSARFVAGSRKHARGRSSTPRSSRCSKAATARRVNSPRKASGFRGAPGFAALVAARAALDTRDFATAEAHLTGPVAQVGKPRAFPGSCSTPR